MVSFAQSTQNGSNNGYYQEGSQRGPNGNTNDASFTTSSTYMRIVVGTREKREKLLKYPYPLFHEFNNSRLE